MDTVNNKSPQPTRAAVAKPSLTGKRRMVDQLRKRYSIGVIALLVGGVSTLFLLQWLVGSPQSIDRSTYQVVYLTSSQAYFGKLQNTTGEYLVMRDPYIAQDAQQPGTVNAAASKDTTLAKVSEQVYGPNDSIAFRKEQVLFWQNLKNDSKVVKAIESKQ